MPKPLMRSEKETIICFNEAEATAHIFTYSKPWQKHLEQKLGLGPVYNNGHGGKEYKIDKRRIRPPLAPRKLSDEARRKLTERLTKNRQRKYVLSAKSTKALGDFITKN